MKPAVFLDRDGTLIELVHHLTDPKKVKLMPRAAQALRALSQVGYACVLVTNQSVIARGLLTIPELEQVHVELARQLDREGAALDGIYFCPELPQGRDQTVIEHPERKPGPGMLLRAARELALDIGSSWMVGDSISDVLAGRNAGCRATMLVHTGYGSESLRHPEHFDYHAPDLWAAAQLIRELSTSGPGDNQDQQIARRRKT
jgi:D-glycero-D-manno-heptose 1,7-bisphosphate phosphatase